MRKLFFVLLLILPALACTMSSQTRGASRQEPTASQAAAFITLSSSPTPDKIPAPTPESETMCHVKTGIETGLLNLRDGPSMSYKPLQVLHEGDPLTILQPARDGWTQVRSSAIQGWVNSNYVTCGEENKP